MDEAICQFCAVTCASFEEAKHYLKSSYMNLEQAIILYFESKSSKEGSEVHVESKISDDSVIQEQINKDTKKTLIYSCDVSKDYDNYDSVAEKPCFSEESNASGSMLKYTQFYPNRTRKGVFNQTFSSVWENDDISATQEERSKKSRLAYLFRPPFDIIKNVDLETAREEAKNRMLWVMINLQDNTDFSCQKLNRDLWKDQRIKDVIVENFIFLQYISTSQDGILYQRFYPIKEYPHIAIIDPRTGERVKVWNSSTIEPDGFLIELHDFLEQYSLDPNFKNPVLQKSPVKRIEDMTEAEQINAALIASLKDRNSTSNDKVFDKKEIVVIPDDSENTDHNDIQNSLSLFQSISTIAPPEPESTSLVTNIQFRFSDGSKKIRSFNLSDKISRLFEYLRSELRTDTREFGLVYNRIKLINELDRTLDELKLKNVSITVEFL